MKDEGREEGFPSPLVEGDGASAELLRRFVRQAAHASEVEAEAWSRTSARLSRGAARPSRAWAVFAVAMVVALAALSTVRRRPGSPTPVVVSRTPTAASRAPAAPSPVASRAAAADVGVPELRLGPVAIDLPAGRARLVGDAAVALSPAGRARASAVPDATTVELEAGALELRVEKRTSQTSRVFRVLAEPYQFTVLGTVFRVSRDGGRISLSVSEGRVAVSRGATPLAVVASGETWSGSLEARATKPVRPSAAAPGLAAPSAPVPSAPAAPASSAPEPGTPPSDEPKVAAPAAPPGPAAAASPPPASRCAARAAQDPAGAIACLVSAAQGSDVGAEVALYEAARLYRDALGDPRGAIATLREARRRFPAGALATEIDLSLVELLPKVGKYREALDESAAMLAGDLGRERASELRLLRGNVLRAGLDDCAAAEPEYAAAARADGERTSDPASFWRAVCLEQLDRPADARRAFEDYLARPHPGRAAEAARHLAALGGGSR
jgi:ferric-dicitrate binding protein FerR (iron transport regulator)